MPMIGKFTHTMNVAITYSAAVFLLVEEGLILLLAAACLAAYVVMLLVKLLIDHLLCLYLQEGQVTLFLST
jgi:hypothetical protein